MQTMDEVIKSQREAQERADTILSFLTQHVKPKQKAISDRRSTNVPLVQKVLTWLKWRSA
jgi:hypothetical protein